MNAPDVERRAPDVAPIDANTFAVTIDGRTQIVYVVADGKTRWASCNGEVFHQAQGSGLRAEGSGENPAKPGARAGAVAALPITAPMPAKVLKVAVSAGATVKKGETLIILEAMKMELPLRASSDGTVTAVHCREGELVQPDTVLVELS